jgi:hypothetical protein
MAVYIDIDKKFIGTPIKLGRNYIFKGRYQSVLKDSRNIVEFLEINGFGISKNEFSPSTKSYYIEADNENIFFEIRVSNHTKPGEDNTYNVLIIKDGYNQTLDIKANILDKSDLKLFYENIKNIM